MEQAQSGDSAVHSAKAWTHAIGQRMQAVRQAKNITAQALSGLTAQYGYEVSRNTITAIETNRKELLTVKELVTLARALEVAPIALLYPTDTRGTVSVPADPPALVQALDAARWFTGEITTTPDVTSENRHEYGRGDYDASTGLFEWYDLPGNDAGGLTTIRKLETLAASVIELWATGRTFLANLVAAETAEARDAWRAAFYVVRERIEGVLRAYDQKVEELEGIGFKYRDRFRVDLEKRIAEQVQTAERQLGNEGGEHTDSLRYYRDIEERLTAEARATSKLVKGMDDGTPTA